MNRPTASQFTRRVVTVLVCMAALTGCVKNDTKATISPAGKVSGTIVFAYQRAALKELGLDPGDKAVKAKPKAPKVPKGVTYKYLGTKDVLGAQYTLKNVSPDVFSFVFNNADDLKQEDPDTTPILVKEGSTWKFTLSSAKSSAPDTTVAAPTTEPSEEGKKFEEILAKYPPRITISLTFPGAVTAADPSAVISGNTVSWNLTLKKGDKFELSATANA
jgi:hypothetical protein